MSRMQEEEEEKAAAATVEQNKHSHPEISALISSSKHVGVMNDGVTAWERDLFVRSYFLMAALLTGGV